MNKIKFLILILPIFLLTGCWNYNELKHKSLYTHRALMIWWCNVYTINYYTNRNLQKVQMKPEIYNTYFKDKDWEKLEKDQFVFEGDTMYYCVY